MGTGNNRRGLESPPIVDAVSLPGRGPSDVWEAHRLRLESVAVSIETLTPATLVDLVLDLQKAALEHHVSRGVYVPAPSDDSVSEIAGD